MWACNDRISEGEYDDGIYPQSPEVDEEEEEAEEWREIEIELFSKFHYDYDEEKYSDASFNKNAENATNSPNAGNYVKERPLLRKRPEKCPGKYYHCGNCDEKGHLSQDCYHETKRVCTLCGEFGHFRNDCPRVPCFNCKFPGHRFAQCPSHKNSRVTCYRCEMFGHTQPDCPDLWRRYRYTTARGPIIKIKCKVNKRVYCFNCGARGHYGHECMKNPMNAHTYWTYPFIVSYDNTSTYIESQNKRRKIEKAMKIPCSTPVNTPKSFVNSKSSKKKKRKYEVSNCVNGVNSDSIPVNPKSSKKKKKKYKDSNCVNGVNSDSIPVSGKKKVNKKSGIGKIKNSKKAAKKRDRKKKAALCLNV